MREEDLIFRQLIILFCLKKKLKKLSLILRMISWSHIDIFLSASNILQHRLNQSLMSSWQTVLIFVKLSWLMYLLSRKNFQSFIRFLKAVYRYSKPNIWNQSSNHFHPTQQIKWHSISISLNKEISHISLQIFPLNKRL
jgi:hypothetical protein